MNKIHKKVIGSKFMFIIFTIYMKYALKQHRPGLLTLYLITDNVDVVIVMCSSRSATF